ncbi:MAG: DUF1800 family protein [Saprospiraceae bacterium]|nr:DUF1800 family protein [Saprospiraceae bacterium]
MNRRNFLKVSKKSATLSAPPPPIGDLNLYTSGKLSKPELIHLFKRTMYGLKYSDLTLYSNKNLPEIIAQLLTNDATDPDLVLSQLPDKYWEAPFMDKLKADLFAGKTPYNLDKMVPSPPENFYNRDYYWPRGTKNEYWKIYDDDVPEGKPFVLSRASDKSIVSNEFKSVYTTFHTIDYQRWTSKLSWRYQQMISQQISIREKMTLFWSNFFPTSSTKTYLGNYYGNFQHHAGYWYDQLLRFHSIGNYRTLLRKVTTHPQMLNFLDGIVNNVQNPNQNYGRELQEVYAIGLTPSAVDDGSSYTEQDVVELSRILSGWESDHAAYGLLREKFSPWKHDYGKTTSDTKKLSRFYNNKEIGNHGITNSTYQLDTDGTKGKSELEEYFNLIFSDPRLQKIIAQNVIRKLYRYFVNTHISDEVESVIINGLVDELIKQNFEIKPVLKMLFSSNHFYQIINRGALIKPPVDHAVSIFREFEYKISLPERSLAFYELCNMINFSVVQDNGQSIEFVNAFGWRAYYDRPVYDRNWLNGSSMVTRIRHFSNLINGNLYEYTNRDFWTLQFDFVDLVIQHFGVSRARNETTLSEDLLAWLLVVPLCPDSKIIFQDKFKDHVNSKGMKFNDLFSNYLADPTNQNAKKLVQERIIEALMYLNTTEEFHLI